MLGFKHNEILEGIDFVSWQLCETRREKGLTLEEAAKKSDISLNYIGLMEQGRIDALPEGVYSKNYLREYAVFLGLNPDPLLKILNKEIAEKQNQDSDVFKRKMPKRQLFLSTPKIIKSFLLVLAVLICIGYLAFYLGKVIAPPEIEIYYPKEDIVTINKNIKIIGQTENEAKLTVNNELVLLDPEGNFEKEIDLSSGVNIINITAEKKYGQKTSIIRNIIVEE